jgi:hypothetical protein
VAASLIVHSGCDLSVVAPWEIRYDRPHKLAVVPRNSAELAHAPCLECCSEVASGVDRYRAAGEGPGS